MSFSFSLPQSGAKPLLSLTSLCLVQKRSKKSHLLKVNATALLKRCVIAALEKTLAWCRYLNGSLNITLRQFFQYALIQKEYIFAHNFIDFFF